MRCQKFWLPWSAARLIDVGRARRAALARLSDKRVGMSSRVLLLAAGLLPLVSASVIKDLHGPQRSEVLYASSGGGTHVYISGTDIGSAFAPPTVALGHRGEVECKVQPFTSTNNRLHCIISAANAPAPTPDYRPDGEFVELPLHLYHRGKLARCWHTWRSHLMQGPCAVRFDVGGTLRVLRLLTQTVESAGVLRISGEGIDGGLSGAQRLAATLYRGAVPVLGACGEKDCQASNMGAEALGCHSRPDAGGDGVAGESQESQLATVFSDGARFGCVLDRLSGGMAGGYFNVSLTAIIDEAHRGDAYLGFLGTRMIDVATGRPCLLQPRLTCMRARSRASRGRSTDGRCDLSGQAIRLTPRCLLASPPLSRRRARWLAART